MIRAICRDEGYHNLREKRPDTDLIGEVVDVAVANRGSWDIEILEGAVLASRNGVWLDVVYPDDKGPDDYILIGWKEAE